MEIAQIYLERQKQRKEEQKKEYHLGTFHSNDVIVTFDGQTIGEMQSLTTKATVEHVPNRNFIEQEERTGSITIDQTELPPWLDFLLRGYQMTGRQVSVSFGTIDEEGNIHPNRAERRKKASMRKNELKKNMYRTNIRNLKGGRKKWN